jgi:hypothetical protein
MRFFAVLSAVSAVAATAVRTPLKQGADSNIPLYAPEVTVVIPSKDYVVKLECPGCPFAVETNTGVSWQHPPQDNVLVRIHLFMGLMRLTSPQLLEFAIDSYDPELDPTLLLNKHRILPLGPMPIDLKAFQVPANVTSYDITQLWLRPSGSGVYMPLQYEHTVMRTQNSDQLLIQFDVTGLPSQETDGTHYRTLDAAPMMRLEGDYRKLVQLLMREDDNTREMFIDDIQVVARKDRALPYRMKCGSLAMEQTAFDPTEWDQYGKIGTLMRLLKLVIGKLCDFWLHSALVLPLSLLLILGLVMLQRQIWQREQEKNSFDDDAEDALLGSGYDDAPPAYADIPVIKIEEYE